MDKVCIKKDEIVRGMAVKDRLGKDLLKEASFHVPIMVPVVGVEVVALVARVK